VKPFSTIKSTLWLLGWNLPKGIRLSMVSMFFAILVLAAPRSALGAFGVTDNGTQFVVDTGAGLVFKVTKSDGNILSWVYNGVEYNGPSGKGSEIASGLGSTGTTVTATNTGNVVEVTIHTDTSNTVCSNLTHYLIVTNGVNNVYMATYLTSEPGVGEFRWITRLAFNLLPNGPAPSNNNGNTGAIESSDVFGHADGTTTSKYYGDGVTHGKDRALEMTYCGATGNNVGAWMVYDNRESSSGGPFYRDIQNQGDGANSDQEIYNYMNSGHAKTEAWRTNVLYGPYVLVWNNGSTPTLPIDTSWIGSLGLTGWVDASGRGTVSGTASGIQSGIQGVVGLANSTAQYWGKVDGTGNYTITGVKAGTYTATLYQGELGVASGSVTVTAGSTSPLNLASTWPNPSTVFTIGDWDGTPQGFLNATNILGYSFPNFISMHPQDVRMNTWGASNVFNVGTDPISTFPSIIMRGTNAHTFINFTLSSGQITNLTLKIGASTTYIGARPDVIINGHDLGYPAASSWTGTRTWTVGTYRGYNQLWTWTVPSADLIVGQNTFNISAVSGSTDGSAWLSAGWVYDAVELDGPSSAPQPPPAPTGLAATAGDAQVSLTWNASSGATSYNVKRATVSGGPYTTIASPTTTSYTDTTAVNGTTYYYVVSAVNGSGESANSTEVSATPSAPAAPAAPTNLAASSPRKKQITLNWTQSTSPNIASNKVYRAPVNGGPYSLVTTIAAATTYTDTGLTSGTTYYYVVTAVDSNNLESANSNQASAAAK
jgi:rhamnogalacturonan endolyase